MPKFIKTDKIQDNVFIHFKLSEQIIGGTLEHTIEFMVDNKIDMMPFEKRIKNDKTGRPAWNPKILLKIILFSYSRGVISSRKIHELCRQNVIAMTLAENSLPDFTVIADFISTMKDEISTVFMNILLVADEMKLLGNTTFALDGCKLSSNASKEWSGTFSDLEKKAKKMKRKIELLIEKHKAEDELENKNEIKEDKVKSIDKLQSKIDKINNFLSNNKEKIGKRYKENQSNITDNESAKMKTSHGTLQGYNGQALVDYKHQIIVAAEVFGQGSDSNLLSPLMDKAKDNYKGMGKDMDFFEGKTVIADTGYFSESNLKKASEEKLDAYIPDQQFRKRDERFSTKGRHDKNKSDRFDRDDFKYDSEKDIVVCPTGNILAPGKKTNKLRNFTYKKYIGKKSFCDKCPDRLKCLRNKNTRYRIYQIAVEDEGRDEIKEMIKKIDTPWGRDIYSRRMGIVEPVFANIRIHKRMNRFTLRGKEKVNIQWQLFCIVHNLGKIMRYGGRLESL
jgi:transposase